MKSMMLRSSLNLDQNGVSIYSEFGIKIDQFDKCLATCLALWKKVCFIISILKNQKSIDDSLARQFTEANSFLIAKLQ